MVTANPETQTDPRPAAVENRKRARTPMLAPAAYSEAMLPALQLARSSRRARRIGRMLLAMLVMGFLLVALAPWQQSVRAKGNVVAFAPGERRQFIQVPIKGRLHKWGPEIFENAHVKAGQLIAEIQDIDPLRMPRLQEQLTASEAEVQASEQQLDASQSYVDAARQLVQTLEDQLQSYQEVRTLTIASADAAIATAQNKIKAAEEQLNEYKAARIQFKADYERQEKLFARKIVAEVKLQKARQKYQETEHKVGRAEAYVQSANNDLIGKQHDRNAKAEKGQADIEYVQASLDKARAAVAEAESKRAKAQAELNKSQKSLLEMQTKVARQQNQQVTAPFDGFLTQITPNQGGQILKDGDVLCVIVPDTSDRAVQVWLNGNDASLVSAGRHVRLQFEGWPAVQFAGWPSVAVGTFGGTVVSIDSIDNGKGQFRALVKPDESSVHWPNERFLRQGVRVNSWVLLEQVPLWYEIWRNMNGFPPVVEPNNPDSKDGDKTKKPKLPK